MFSTVLVPLDGTPLANAALPLARTVAQACGSTITMLRVVQPDDAVHSEQAIDGLRRIANELAGADVQVTSVVIEAETAADAILEQIGARSVDLVIMRTHGRAGIGRA